MKNAKYLILCLTIFFSVIGCKERIQTDSDAEVKGVVGNSTFMAVKPYGNTGSYEIYICRKSMVTPEQLKSADFDNDAKCRPAFSAVRGEVKFTARKMDKIGDGLHTERDTFELKEVKSRAFQPVGNVLSFVAFIGGCMLSCAIADQGIGTAAIMVGTALAFAAGPINEQRSFEAKAMAEASDRNLAAIRALDSSVTVNAEPKDIARAIASHSKNAIAYAEANFSGW